MPLHHFLIPLCPKTDVGRGRLKMVVLSGNGRRAGNTCGRKSKGDEKQLNDLEWPYISYISSLTLFTINFIQDLNL